MGFERPDFADTQSPICRFNGVRISLNNLIESVNCLLQFVLSVRKLVYEVAGGPINGEVKAVLSGFFAGVIAGNELDTNADFGSLPAIGSGLGSAGFIVLNSARSLVRVAQAAARFLYVESCNQCPAC